MLQQTGVKTVGPYFQKFVARWPDVGALGRIHLDGQHVGRIRFQVRRQLERERRVASAIFAQLVAVDGDRGGGHDTGKIHEDAAAGRWREFEMAAVDGDELEILFVETVPGENFVGVRDGDALEFAIVEIRRGAPWHRAPAVSPVPVHGQDTGVGGRCRLCRSSRLPEGRGAAGFQKASSIKCVHYQRIVPCGARFSILAGAGPARP